MWQLPTATATVTAPATPTGFQFRFHLASVLALSLPRVVAADLPFQYLTSAFAVAAQATLVPAYFLILLKLISRPLVVLNLCTNNC